jgi:hypothetical protein
MYTGLSLQVPGINLPFYIFMLYILAYILPVNLKVVYADYDYFRFFTYSDFAYFSIRYKILLDKSFIFFM